MPDRVANGRDVDGGIGLQAQPSGVMARLRGSLHALPLSEAMVARFLAEHPVEAVRLPVKTLAIRIGVSEATIVRCCRSLGFEGLRDLKFALAAEAATPLQTIHEDILPTDGVGAIARKVLQSDIQAIADTLAVLDEGALERAVAALLGATRIECYGVGSSRPIAVDAYYRFLRIGLPATVVDDPHMQAVSAAALPLGAVAFAVSHTGRTTETLNALQKAKDAGAICILLTSYPRTPLGKYADIELVTAASETAFRSEAVASRIAHLSMVDALYVAVAMRRFDTALAALDRANGIIAERRIR